MKNPKVERSKTLNNSQFFIQVKYIMVLVWTLYYIYEKETCLQQKEKKLMP